MASQMAPAILDTVVVLVEAGDYIFRASGSTIKFPGFMTLYIENTDNGEQTDEDGMLPDLTRGELLKLLELTPNQHFTQPPPRSQRRCWSRPRRVGESADQAPMPKSSTLSSAEDM